MPDPLNIALATAGLTVVVIALLSEQLKKSPVQEPMLAVAVGIAIGPIGFGLLTPGDLSDPNGVLEQVARLTLAISVMGVALRVSRVSFGTLWRPVALLLTLGMFVMWAVSTLVVMLTLGLPFWLSALIGAAITPTDPVVASSVVTGPFAKRKLPRRFRDAVSMESAANDGLGYVFVTLAMLFALGEGAGGLGAWLTEDVVRGIVFAALLGAILGLTASLALNAARQRGLIERHSLLSYTVALSLGTLGVTHALGGDGILAVFVAGMCFNLTADRGEEKAEEDVQEAVNKLFTLPAFVFIGAFAPVAEWIAEGWPLALCVVLVLALRRPLALLACGPFQRRQLNRSDRRLMGWFGPIGVAAAYYAAFARAHGADETVWVVVSAVVMGSIFAHGLTSAPLARIYARNPGPIPPYTHDLQEISEEERRSASG